MKILKVGDKITVKTKVLCYEAYEWGLDDRFKEIYLEPGDTAVVFGVKVPYVRSRGTFTAVRFTKNGLNVRTGIDNGNVVYLGK